MFLLEPFVQNYDWGKLGSSSAVADLISAGYGKAIDEGKPYAELWMGDHINGICHIIREAGMKISIQDFLTQHSLTGSLKFLFKVLSVGKSLSIQSHPDAQLAAHLHATFPQIYKDPNPKPELAIALTPFRALFGFRPISEIITILDELPMLERVIPRQLQDDLRERSVGLRSAYTSVMTSTESNVKQVIQDIVACPLTGLSSVTAQAIQLARELNTQFPGGDVGVLSVFLLNIVDLEPMECLFMAANVPHAYISGDLIECMTSSDNVIRGGLTPKFKDIETLVSSLDYTSTIPS